MPEKSSEELNAEVKKLLIIIDELEKRKTELAEKVIPEMLREANKPVYVAKEQAEKIIADANAVAEKIKEEASKLIPEAKQKASTIEQEADAFLLAARKKDTESAKIKESTEKEKVDFEAEKYAHETNLATKRDDAEALMGNALTLQTEQNARKTNLDGRESIVIKKEQDYQNDLTVLEKKLNDSTDGIAELKAVEQAHADEKIEIATLKSENEDILAKIKKEREEQQAEVEKSRMIYTSALKKEEEAEAKIRKNTAHLNSIAKERADADDKIKTAHERERMNKILERQIDLKISTLKKLRKEDAERSPSE